MMQDGSRLDNIKVSDMTDADLQAVYLGILNGTSKNPANDCDKLFRAVGRREKTIEDVLNVHEAGLRNAAGIFSMGDGLVTLGRVGSLRQAAAAHGTGKSKILGKLSEVVRKSIGQTHVFDPVLASKIEELEQGLFRIFSGLHVATAFEPLPYPYEFTDNLSADEQLNQKDWMATKYINHAVSQLVEAGISPEFFEVEELILRSQEEENKGTEQAVKRYRLVAHYLSAPRLLFRELKERCNQGGFFDPVVGPPMKELVTEITETERAIEHKLGDPSLNEEKIEKLRDDLSQMYSASIGGYAILKKKTSAEGTPAEKDDKSPSS